MRRLVKVLLVSSFIIAGCSSSGPTGATQGPGGGGPTATAATGGGGGGGDGAALIEAAQAVEHACTLVPADMISALVPDGSAPSEEQFPKRCGVYGSTTAIGWTIAATDSGASTPPAGAQAVQGVGAGAWIERLVTTNWSITVLLTPSDGRIYAEVNNGDGQDHAADVVNLAKAILASLGG